MLGAGVMGAAIAAHLANVGIPALLLDVVPAELTEEEKKKGLTLQSPLVRNRLSQAGLERCRRSKPASFYSEKDAALVATGNFEDDLSKLKDADWIVEAVTERLDIKQQLFGKIVPHLKAGAILSSNTSGISIRAIGEALPAELRRRFLGTHFFNPPRYLKLLELVPHPDTAPEVLSAMSEFGARTLGKGIVVAKDTPNFIANRVGSFAMLHAVKLMLELDYSIAEVDKLTGKAIGRPKSATFRTADIVGLDTLAHVAANMLQSLPDERERELFRPPPLIEQMLQKGLLGEKTRKGFYSKDRTSGQILMLEPKTLQYVPQPKVAIPSLEMAKSIDDAGARIRSLVEAKDRAGVFLWKNVSATLRYAAACIPEISDDLAAVDAALRWGFGWELGPFQIWDAIGFRKSCERMKAEGQELPGWVEQMLAAGVESFYRREAGRTFVYVPAQKKHAPLPEDPRVIVLRDWRERRKPLLDTADVSLHDLGEQVLCLEFRTKMNTIGPGVIDGIHKSLDLMEGGAWRGLVLGNNADLFSAGANLLMVLNELDEENYEDVEWMVRRFQQTCQRLRYSARPVVAAPHGLTLGGGCELTLGCDAAAAAAETYIGLVEVGAGLIPAGGGCMHMIARIHETAPDDPGVDLFPYVRRVFEQVGMAKVATSAKEAVELGYLRPEDRITVNGDHLLHNARDLVLAMDLAGYQPPRPRTGIRVVGEPGLAALRVGMHNLRRANRITEYDHVVGGKLAWVLCGGEVSPSARVDEDYLLDLERQAFLELCRDPRTQARMGHILKTGKPLRN